MKLIKRDEARVDKWEQFPKQKYGNDKVSLHYKGDYSQQDLGSLPKKQPPFATRIIRQSLLREAYAVECR